MSHYIWEGVAMGAIRVFVLGLLVPAAGVLAISTPQQQARAATTNVQTMLLVRLVAK